MTRFEARLVEGAIEVCGPDGRQLWLDRCPHAGLPLSRPDGTVLVQEGRFLVCPAHGASFDLADEGRCVGGPCSGARLSPLTPDGGSPGG